MLHCVIRNITMSSSSSSPLTAASNGNERFHRVHIVLYFCCAILLTFVSFWVRAPFHHCVLGSASFSSELYVCFYLFHHHSPSFFHHLLVLIPIRLLHCFFLTLLSHSFDHYYYIRVEDYLHLFFFSNFFLIWTTTFSSWLLLRCHCAPLMSIWLRCRASTQYDAASFLRTHRPLCRSLTYTQTHTTHVSVALVFCLCTSAVAVVWPPRCHRWDATLLYSVVILLYGPNFVV